MTRFNQLLAGLLLLLLASACAHNKAPDRQLDLNREWKFKLDSTILAYRPDFDDSKWRTVNLPHDWSVEFPFDTVNLEGCTGWLPGGIGWYRKTFDAPADKEVHVLFDGVYNNATFWINGKELGFHPYGYTPVHFNLTPYLHANGKDNVLAVKVDRSRYADSRWYTGSGIYRKVQLIVTDKLHIPIWGTFVSTPEVTREQAKIHIQTSVVNRYSKDKDFVLKTILYDPNGEKAAESSVNIHLPALQEQNTETEMTVRSPLLWDVEQPQLYKAVSQIIIDDKIVDHYETVFGIRTFRFDADKGFFLNGRNLKIKGVCLHHDGGLTGAAVPRGVWQRRLQALKEAGCNAIRSAHNPASEEFLQLCDEMGFLVQDEFFDQWDYPKDKRLNMNQSISTDYITRGYEEYFQEWAKQDLRTCVLAHRNHPCIFQWSIGNEIEWTYPRNKKATGFWDADWSGNYFWSPTPLTPEEIKKRYESLPALAHTIGETAQKLSAWTKELDTTRPVTANCILPSASYVTGYADALDVIGFSYRRVMYDYGHKYFPEKPLMGTENLPQWHEWKAIMERDFVPGTFLWTGIDYMGEAHYHGQGRHRRGTQSGLLDYAGFPKTAYYMFKSLWSSQPTFHITTQNICKSIYKIENGEPVEKTKDGWQHALWFWPETNTHWNYQEGDSIVVEVISNLPEVELFLNGESLGSKKLSQFEDHIYKWLVIYKEGTLEARGTQNGQPVTSQIKTAGTVGKIKLTCDHLQLLANGEDVAHIVVQLTDENGVPVQTDERELSFDIKGDVKLLGVDNGDAYSMQPYQSNKIITSKGRALLIVQAKHNTGTATITAHCEGLADESLQISLQ